VLREKKKRLKLAELGIDYDFPGYEDNMEQNDSIGSTSSSSRKRKDLVSSDTDSAKNSSKVESSLKEILDEAEAANETGSAKKKKQKDSIGSTS
jgi:hypothetical protein